METCDFSSTCPFYSDNLPDMPENAAEIKKEYCETGGLRCARYMVYQAKGAGAAPDTLMPKDKTDAYGIIAG